MVYFYCVHHHSSGEIIWQFLPLTSLLAQPSLEDLDLHGIEPATFRLHVEYVAHMYYQYKNINKPVYYLNS